MGIVLKCCLVAAPFMYRGYYDFAKIHANQSYRNHSTNICPASY